MALVGKVAFVVAILLAIHVVDSALTHRHHKGHRHGDNRMEFRQSGENAVDYRIHGQISCYGTGMDYLRPYLHTRIYPNVIINLGFTQNGGYYHLTTGPVFDLRGKVELMIRHQCNIEGLPPMPKCAVAYYTTNIEIELPDNGTTVIPFDFDLYKLKKFSTADCLY